MGRVRGGFIKVAAATPRVVLADCATNAKHIGSLITDAAAQGVSIVAFPQRSITGCSCGELFTQQALLDAAQSALNRLLLIQEPIVSIVGMPVKYNGRIYDCAVVFSGGVIYGVVPRSYGVGGVFTAGRGVTGFVTLCDQVVEFGSDLIFDIDGVKFGVEVGDDCRQIITPSAGMAAAGAVITICLDAKESYSQSYQNLKGRVTHHSAAICSGYIYASASVGESTTDLVYEGAAMVAQCGELLAERERFARTDSLTVADVDVEAIEHARLAQSGAVSCDDYRVVGIIQTIVQSPLVRNIDPAPFIPKDLDAGCAEVLELQAAGLAQRLDHTHCSRVVLGISGGLDSTLALIAVVRTFDMLGLDRKDIVGVTMPGFGTTGRTYNNALVLMQELGITLREVSIKAACEQHFKDIELDPSDRSAAYENSQARERTQILMDIANAVGGMVIGTGDLSESALGWATYNGDHMSMYNVNCSVPKTLVRVVTKWAATVEPNEKVRAALMDIVDTPVSPELLPADDKGNITQKTEDLVGPYELHDFFIYHFILNGFAPSKILLLACRAFEGQYSEEVIKHWLTIFLRRFFAQQYKRSAVPDGPKVTPVSLSPRGGWAMPSDANVTSWLEELN